MTIICFNFFKTIFIIIQPTNKGSYKFFTLFNKKYYFSDISQNLTEKICSILSILPLYLSKMVKMTKISQQFIIMSHKYKLQQFRVQLRNKEIKQIIAQKRLWRDYKSQNCNQIPPIQHINLTLLMHLAKVAQFQQNIQSLHRLGWHKELVDYLSPNFNFTEQQRFAAAALCNIMYVKDVQEPTQSIAQNISQILDGSSSMKVLESILTLVSNLAHDHKLWLDNLILNHNLIQKLVHIFSFQNLNHSILYNLLLTICQIISVASFSPQFIKIAEPVFNLVNSNLVLDSEFLRPTMFFLCQLSKKFQKQVSIKMFESRFFKKMGAIIKVLSDMRIIDNYVTLVSQTIEYLECETFETLIFPVLCQKIMISTLKVKQKILRLIYYAMEQKKLDLYFFWKHPVSSKLLQLFQVIDNLNILQQLCYIFCICIINLKNRKKQTLHLVDLIKQKRILLVQNIDIQGLIDQTLLMYEKENSI